MGLIIRPKSKLRALACRLFSWESLKSVYRDEPITIETSQISKIYIPANTEKTYWISYSADGFDTQINFYADEVNDLNELENIAKEHSDKVVPSKLALIKGELVAHFKLHFKYGAFIEKFVLGVFALTFMFYQFKYFGSLMIQKYQFLIKTSCNERCAEMLWSTSVWWFYGLLLTLSPIILVVFYKRIHNSILRSKDIQTINATRSILFYMTVFGLYSLVSSTSLISTTAVKYSKIIAAYSDGTLETKLSQKIEMASKRKFQGDIDEVEVLEDQREE